MRVTVDRKRLYQALDAFAAFKPTQKDPAPLHTAKCAANGRLEMSATDLTTHVATSLDCTTAVEGEACIPMGALRQLVHKLLGADVTLDVTGATCRVACGASQATLPAAPVCDFPQAPTVGDVSWYFLDTQALIEAIDACLPAVATDESRYHLTGALLEKRGRGWRMVATDGHHMHVVDADGAAKFPTMACDCIIPRTGLAVLRRALRGYKGETVSWAHAGEHVHFQVGDVALTIKLVQAKFPPYDMCIPKDHERSIVVDRAVLDGILQRLKVYKVDRVFAVKLRRVAGAWTVETNNPDMGAANEPLAVVSSAGDAEDFAVGVNGIYLQEALDACAADEVTVETSGELDPVKIGDGLGVLCIVMPMRI